MGPHQRSYVAGEEILRNDLILRCASAQLTEVPAERARKKNGCGDSKQTPRHISGLRLRFLGSYPVQRISDGLPQMIRRIIVRRKRSNSRLPFEDLGKLFRAAPTARKMLFDFCLHIWIRLLVN